MARKILVVDDEPNILECLTYALETSGFDVIRASNGLEALGAARIHRPDLVLLDVIMPGENGYRVARTLREDQELGIYSETMTILLMTARDLSDNPTRERIFNEFSRADAVIYKPFDLDELIDRIHEAFARTPASVTNDGRSRPPAEVCWNSFIETGTDGPMINAGEWID